MDFKNWATVAKVFLEKHLIPTVIGVIVALGTYAIVPKNTALVVNLGKTCFLVFIWAIVFIALQFIIFLYNTHKKTRLKRENDIFYNEQKKIEFERQLKQLWRGI